jgi:microcystin-dependent protein
MDAYIGEIRLFAGNFDPAKWALCNGQLIAIPANTALFSILGTTYGGNGTTNFALPNLQSRVPVGAGSAPGLSPYELGEEGGVEQVTLTMQTMPSHTHGVQLGGQADAAQLAKSVPVGNYYCSTDPNSGSAPMLYASTPNASMGASTSTPVGSGQPHANMQPTLGLSFIICLQGIYPPRG